MGFRISSALRTSGRRSHVFPEIVRGTRLRPLPYAHDAMIFRRILRRNRELHVFQVSTPVADGLGSLQILATNSSGLFGRKLVRMLHIPSSRSRSSVSTSQTLMTAAMSRGGCHERRVPRHLFDGENDHEPWPHDKLPGLEIDELGRTDDSGRR